ncbi:MAG: DNA polymerase III subunit gamma/tau, partial [Thermoleophilia bacterium]|nr:DNA polymerase III subunit gamma/tau [Thermoleophilia bacterium]
LINAIKRDRVSHAYLFAGPRGTGKTSTAKILAMALNCEAGQGKPTAEPDGTCAQCEAIRRGSALDVVEMDAASNRGIDDIRELRDKVHFAPVEGRMKVYIVDEVHMLTPEAFNALLKTLEEPPAHAVFVLATTEPHKVPATILSRCQRFDFRRPSVTEVANVLTRIATQENIQVPEGALTLIARAAGGSFRDAIGILDQLATYCSGNITLRDTLDILGLVQHDLLSEIVEIVAAENTREAILFVERLNQAGTDFTQFLKDLLGYLRDLFVVRHTDEPPAGSAMSEEQLPVLQSQAHRLSAARIVSFIDLIGEALRAIRQGADARLELELVLIKMTALTGATAAEWAIEEARAVASPSVGVSFSTAAAGSRPLAGVAAAGPGEAASGPRTPAAGDPAVQPGVPAATEPAVQAPGAPAGPAGHGRSTTQRRPVAPGAAEIPDAAGSSSAGTSATGPDSRGAGSASVPADVEHLRRAWPIV